MNPIRSSVFSSMRVSLSGKWRFAVDPTQIGEAEGWMGLGFGDAEWEVVNVPHTWNVTPEHRTFEGIAWYRRTFKVPEEDRGAFLRLRFEGVFYQAQVWMNGHYLGRHEGGYTPFEFDLSQAVLLDKENLIAVRVDNLRQTDRLPADLYEGRSYGWRNYGGIVRNASLLINNPVYLSAQRVISRPHLVDADCASSAAVMVTLSVRNAAAEKFSGKIIADILEAENGQSALSGEITSNIGVLPGQILEVTLRTTFANPRLWHFDHPHLYCWSASLLDDKGEILDDQKVWFGVRLIELKDAQIHLNGEPVRLVGLSRHADTPQHGLAETIAVMAADFDDLKRLNMVMGRPVHYPQDEFILNYCDRNGILLSPEVPAWQLTATQMADPHIRELEKQQLSEMVSFGFNHPCIWAWSVGNELETDTVAGRAFIRDMVEYVKSLDPTRPVGFASYHLLVGRPWADATAFTDFVMMNEYLGTWHGPKDALDIALDTTHSAWPEKPVLISEFGISPDWQKIEGPAWIDPQQYYIASNRASQNPEEVDALRCRLIDEQIATFRNKPFVAGAFFWCYRGGMGVVDEDGCKRKSWSILQREFSPIVLTHVEALMESERVHGIVIELRTRGPINSELPSYTLRDYRLHWQLISQNGSKKILEGDLMLPELSPGKKWGEILNWDVADQEYCVELSVIRPTGFPVLEKIYDPWKKSLVDRPVSKDIK